MGKVAYFNGHKPKISVRALAKELGVTFQYLYRLEKLPVNRVEEVSKLTGLGRHQLRPDLWEAPPVSEWEEIPSAYKEKVDEILQTEEGERHE